MALRIGLPFWRGETMILLGPVRLGRAWGFGCTTPVLVGCGPEGGLACGAPFCGRADVGGPAVSRPWDGRDGAGGPPTSSISSSILAVLASPHLGVVLSVSCKWRVSRVSKKAPSSESGKRHIADPCPLSERRCTSAASAKPRAEHPSSAPPLMLRPHMPTGTAPLRLDKPGPSGRDGDNFTWHASGQMLRGRPEHARNAAE